MRSACHAIAMRLSPDSHVVLTLQTGGTPPTLVQGTEAVSAPVCIRRGRSPPPHQSWPDPHPPTHAHPSSAPPNITPQLHPNPTRPYLTPTPLHPTEALRRSALQHETATAIARYYGLPLLSTRDAFFQEVVWGRDGIGGWDRGWDRGVGSGGWGLSFVRSWGGFRLGWVRWGGGGWGWVVGCGGG